MSSDMREVRKRLREAWALPGHKSIDMIIAECSSGEEKDLWRVAEAYLDDYAADDDVVVTWGWLRQVGFVGRQVNIFLGYLHVCLVDGGRSWRIGDVTIHKQQTRGDVRRLCVVLGIELKEPADV